MNHYLEHLIHAANAVLERTDQLDKALSARAEALTSAAALKDEVAALTAQRDRLTDEVAALQQRHEQVWASIRSAKNEELALESRIDEAMKARHSVMNNPPRAA